MADDLGADLDQLLLEAGQRPGFCCLGHRQRPHEVAEVIDERMELKADGVRDEGALRLTGWANSNNNWRPCCRGSRMGRYKS